MKPDKSKLCDCDRYDLGEHTVGVCEALREAHEQISKESRETLKRKEK